MNKILVTTTLLFICLVLKVPAQLFHENYSWGEFPVVPENLNDEKLVTLFSKTVIEFAYQGDDFVEFDTEHKILFINSEEEVKRNNNIYIYYNESSEIVMAKARIIKPGKNVIETDDSKILDSYDEETGEKYKYFALEGLEKGDMIELIHVIKQYPDYNGRRVFIQDKDPILRFEFDLFSPENLLFDFLVRNDTNHVVMDTLSENNHWVFYIDSIKGLQQEESAPYKILLKQLIYKLDRNLANNSRDITSYGQASRIIFERVYTNADKQDFKAIDKFLKNADVNMDLPTEEQIFKIENYVKNNINIVEYSNPELEKISSILSNKTASETGMVNLFANIFKVLEIDHQLVVTSDRTSILFDPLFESFNFLTGHLIYFPGTGKYMSPDKFEYRYGLPPAIFTNNFGLFIKRVSLGDLDSGIGKIKYIEPLGYNETYHNHFVIATINPDFSKVDLDVTTKSMGYFASPLQPYMELISEDIKKEVATDGADNYIPNSTVNSWSFLNTEPEKVGKEPFIIKYDISNGDLINVAGDHFLFKIGLLIGPQQELYSETSRILPVYDNYKRTFDRELKIIFPEGFSVTNAGDLDIFAEYVVEGKQILLFKSTHMYSENEIVVNIHEYYDQIEYSVEEYPAYREVVNSASDFNKVTLVVEKQ
ncbi:MAG: DUF3857 domain-containing protein [Bacteroidales bacterium]|nr:DUF3857 domain-containing protein [Bacteroidales bacterium]